MLPELEVSEMRIDIVVILTIIVTHYAEKILDVFDQKAIVVIRKIKTKGKESFKHKTQKPDLKIRKEPMCIRHRLSKIMNLKVPPKIFQNFQKIWISMIIKIAFSIFIYILITDKISN